MLISIFRVTSWFDTVDNIVTRWMNFEENHLHEHSGSVVECLTRDRGAVGLSLTGVTALWSMSKTHLTQLSTGSTQEDTSLYN